jgi:hypothetical protein
MKRLIELAFDNGLTEAEEALLDRLEAEWLARQRAEELEAYDYYSIPKQNKVAHLYRG